MKKMNKKGYVTWIIVIGIIILVFGLLIFSGNVSNPVQDRCYEVTKAEDTCRAYGCNKVGYFYINDLPGVQDEVVLNCVDNEDNHCISLVWTESNQILP